MATIMTSTTSMTTTGDVVASVNDDDVNTITNTTNKGNEDDNKINDNDNDSSSSSSFNEKWKHIVQWISSPILFGLLLVTGSAVRYPKSYIASIIVLSFGLFIGGLNTNFYIESNEAMLWKPIGSQPAIDEVWLNKHWHIQKTKWNKPKVMNNDDEEEEGEEDDEDYTTPQLEKETTTNEIDDGTTTTTTTASGEDDGKTKFITVIVHAQGENVITKEGLQYNFDMIDTVVNTPGYKEYCSKYGTSTKCPSGFEVACQVSNIPTTTKSNTNKICDIHGISAYWFHNSTVYNQQVQTNQDVKERISLPIDQFNIKHIIGFPRDSNNTLIVPKSIASGSGSSMSSLSSSSLGIESGISYTTMFKIEPGGTNAADIERVAVERLLKLRMKWMIDESNPYRVELFGTTTFPDEFVRGIGKDLKLIPMVFLIMSIFTWIIFSKRGGRRRRRRNSTSKEEKETEGEVIIAESRGLLGFGAVICVAFSIMSGYGLMFCCGVPFTVLTLIVPFVIFGVGLDDSYILMTAYDRTDRSKDPMERIQDTINYVGISIFLTTSTSVLAFVLGITSTLPAIRWLCLYAAITILIDFIYQITFFLSMLVLDEQRLQANRHDCFVCCKRRRVTITKLQDNVDIHVNESPTTPLGPPGSDEEDDHHDDIEEGPAPPPPPPEPEVAVKNFTEKFMTWYCEILFLPWVKPLVLAAFMALLVVCSINATKLELEFDFTSLLPDDTYVKPFNKAFTEMGTRPAYFPDVFFRNVDHSDPDIRAQIQDYIDALVEELPHISDPPYKSWLRDYNEYSENNMDLLQGRSFNETIHMFLADPDYNRNRNSFRFDEQGIIQVSKIDIQLDALDLTSADSILSFVRGQKRITSEQPINKDRKEFAFFNFNSIYFLWEFLYVTISELVQTTYLGIATVAVMGLLFMPHWSGIMFVFPLISILYIDLLGVFYMGGISINGVSYIALVMSIGLLVDFILHFIHQYYDSEKIGRTEKAKDVLCTVGVAILQGGISTFLGVLPLAFGSNEVFHIIFVSFAGIVTLGVGHGLILLPVLMSYVGPE